MNYDNFNDIEALKIAINMEEEGLEFYSTLMKNAKEKWAKEIFSKLATEEKKHEETFKNAYREITSSSNAGQGYEDYTVSEYIKHLIDTGVFTQKGEAKRLLSQIKTEIDALKIGIQAEKDAILYYYETAKHARNEAGKKAFEYLLNEEKKHLKLLAEQLKTLKKKSPGD
jgi:rubrerythrin